MIHAERVVNIYDFDNFFEGRCAAFEGVTKAGCFGIMKCKTTGRTILRSKELSHHENWEDDGTVALFHVCSQFVASVHVSPTNLRELGALHAGTIS